MKTFFFLFFWSSPKILAKIAQFRSAIKLSQCGQFFKKFGYLCSMHLTSGRYSIIAISHNFFLIRHTVLHSTRFAFVNVGHSNSKIYLNSLSSCSYFLQYLSNQNLSLYSLYYTKTCNGFSAASLHPENIALFEDMSQRWQAFGNTVSHLTGPRFEVQNYRSRDDRVTARPTCR